MTYIHTKANNCNTMSKA